jgi:hypothetical protein
VSSILKALQRVEQERPAGAPSAPRRALRGDFVADKGKPLLRRPRSRGPNLRLWGSLAAILLLAGLVWWRLPDRTGREVVAAAPEATLGEGVAEPQRAARAEPPLAPAPAAPPVAEVSPAVAAQAAEPVPASAPAPPPPAVPVEVAERLPPLGTTLDAPEPAPVQQAPLQEAPAPAPQPQPAAVAAAEPKPAPAAEPVPPAPAPPVRPAVRPKPAAAPAPRPAPVLARPAPPPAPSAPLVLVERTSWHPSAERRAAWVSVEGITGTRELHEGEAVGALVVKEIRPSSVVFLHGADTLQRRVGTRE